MGRPAGIAVLLACLLLGAACQPQPQRQQAQYYVFGTVVDVVLAGSDEASAATVFAELQTLFQGLHREWHPWEPGQLGDINAALAAGECHTASSRLLELVQHSQAMEQASAGRFNAAIGRLVSLWGFHTSDYPIEGPPPAPEAIQALLAEQASTQDVKIEQSTHGNLLCSGNPAVRLDFSGIAKGAAIDLGLEITRAHGIPAALINAGGDLRAYGQWQEQPWRIGIRRPAADRSSAPVIAGLTISGDEAVFTSGNYQRFRQDQTRRYSHIIDPHSGWPVNHVASVTVIAEQGWLADAAATALVIAGPEDFAATLEALNIQQAILVTDGGQVYASRSMWERLSERQVALEKLTLVD